MFKNLLLFATLLSLQIASSQIYINEIDSDQAGTDTKEFVELKSTTPNFSLDGYVLVFYNAGSSNPYAGTTSYNAIDLDGYTTDPNGIFLIGNSQVSPSPNLVFPSNSIQNGPDVIALYAGDDTDFPVNSIATATNLIDAVAYGTNTNQPSNLMSILGITQFINENSNGSKDTHSCQRKNDGTWEAKLPTPKENNDGSGTVFKYLTTTLSKPFYNEGDALSITFTLDAPVTGSNLIINYTLVNGNFNLSDYTIDQTVEITPGNTTVTVNGTITDDSIDEGDEEFILYITALAPGYVINNNNIKRRVYDNDFVVRNYGKPTTPTYNLVAPTTPAGYYASLEGLSGLALKQELQEIIANKTNPEVRAHTYGDVYDILKESDVNPENPNQVWQMYIETPTSKLDQQMNTSNIGVWNREHIFAQSRAGFQNGTSSTADGINIWLPTNSNDLLAGHSDAHHIRVEDGAENSLRSNRNFGVDYNGPAGNLGSWKGDVARALFYMDVRYNGLNVVNGNPDQYNPSTTISSGNIGDLATLLQWNTLDPADDFEVNRNNYIYTWQMNRNPFIDYPLLADYIFGANFGQPWSFALSTTYFDSSQIKIYPNPASDYLMVSGVEGKSELVIYTITQQVVYKSTFENETRIDLNLPTGMYLVSLANNGNSITKKIIIN